MELTAITERIQEIVGAKRDGKWGMQSASLTLNFLERAVAAAHFPDTSAPATESDATIYKVPSSIDERSRNNINTLQTWVREVAVKFLEECLAAGIPTKIISGWRTDAEQERLYAQGRSAPGRIVTNARAGYSNHNYGIAFDIGIFDESGRYLEESPLYTSASEIGKKLGLSWGGDWTSGDEPHFELRPGWAKTLSENEMLAILRTRKARGESYA